MKFARVVGTTVSTVKDQGLLSLALLLCAPCGEDGKEIAGAEQFVATDTIGAGVGEVVLVAFGSAARVPRSCTSSPTDASIVGIVDSIQLAHRTTYTKG